MYARLLFAMVVTLAYMAAVHADSETLGQKMGIETAQNKLGMIYHEFAAKIDALIGDEEARRVHQFEVDKGRVKEEIQNLKDSMSQSASNAMDKANDAAEQAPGMLEKMKQWTGLASDSTDNLRDRATELKEKAKDASQDTIDGLKKQAQDLKVKATGTSEYDSSSDSWLQDAKDFSSQLKNKAAYFMGFGRAKVEDTVSSAKDKVQDKVQGMQDSGRATLESAKAKAADMKDSVKDKAYNMKEAAKDKAYDMKEQGKIKAEEVKDAAQEKVDSSRGMFQDNIDAAKNKAKSAAERVKEAFVGSSQ